MTLSGSSYPSRDSARKARPRPSLACRLLDRGIPALRAGRLHIVLPTGESMTRHSAIPGPEASIVLRRWRGVWRLLLDGEDGIARGYIDGDWSTPDLAQLLELGVHNEVDVAPQTKWRIPSFISNRIRHAFRANTRRGSRRNIAAHYDLGNDFFAPWLDAGMNYSSALFADGETLEQAQNRKLDRIAELLALDGGERVLEIGCGWGALAERLIRAHGATVCGITLSTEQLAHARTRLAGAIADGRAELRLVDYRDVVGRFDRIASIEMIEAVGERYWPVYFAKLRASLRTGGIALLQAITIDESRFAAYRNRTDFIYTAPYLSRRVAADSFDH